QRAAAAAAAAAEDGEFAAPGAGLPEGRRTGAGRTERRVEGSTPDEPNLAATRAVCTPASASVTPRFVGGGGDDGAGGAAADRAGQHRVRPARGTQRSVRGSGADRAATPAGDAPFVVRRVGNEAVGTQRPAVLVAAGGFSDDTAPRAGLRAGFGHAVAAVPLA